MASGPWDDYTDQAASAPPVDDDTTGSVSPDDAPWLAYQQNDQQTEAHSPAPTEAQSPDNSGPWSDYGQQPADQSSATGAFARGLAKSVAPTVGSLPAIGAGADVGAGIGTALLPGLGTVAGGIIGGGLGAIGAGYLISKAQDWILDKLGLSSSLGSEADAADAEQHPYAQEAGSLAAGLGAFGSGAAKGAARLAGAAIFGGLEAGQEEVQEGKIDPTKVAMAATAGAVAPNPREYAEKLIGAGGRFAGRMVPGRPDVKLDAAAVQDKQDADAANDQPIVAKGVATEQPPVNTKLNVGNPDSKPVRSDRAYGKDNVQAQGGVQTQPSTGVNTDFLHPDQVAALQASLADNSVAGQARAPEPNPLRQPAPGETQAPVSTGLDKLRQFNDNGTPTPPEADLSRLNDQQLVDASQAQRQGIDNAKQNAQPLATGEEAPTSPVYPHPEMVGVNIDRTRAVPGTTITSKDGKTIYVDKNLPPQIEVAGKKLDPALPLGVRERVFREALARVNEAPEGARLPATQRRQAAMEVGLDAEKHWLESRGYDYNAYRDALANTKAAQPAGQVLTKGAAPEGRGTEPAEPVQEQPAAEVPAEPAPEQAAKEPAAAEGETEEISAKTEAPAAPEQAGTGSPGLSKLAGSAPEVTATVKRPKVVDQALAELDKRVANNPQLEPVRKALMEAEPERQGKLARQIMEMVTNRTGKVGGDYATARVPSKPAEVEGMGVTARSKADAARKTGAIAAAKSAFEKFAPTDDVVPTSKAQKAALRDRLQAAIIHANEQNGGKDPITSYKPAKKPAEYQWLKAAQRLVNGRMTQRQIGEFIANEKLLRSGKSEDADLVRSGNRVEADIAMNKKPTAEQAELTGAFKGQQEEFPGERVPAEDVQGTERPATMEDVLPQKEKTLDLSSLSPEQAADLQAQMDRVARNLMGMEDKPEESTAAKLEEQSEATQAKMRRQREAAELQKKFQRKAAGGDTETATVMGKDGKPLQIERAPAASEGRSIQFSDEAKRAVVETDAKLAARDKARNAPEPLPPENEPSFEPKPVGDLYSFFKNQDGKLDINKVQQDVSKRMAIIRAAAERYFAVPDGDVAHKADVVLTQTMWEKARMEARVLHETAADWHSWAKQSLDDTMTFLRTYEMHPDLDRAAFEQVLSTSGISADKAKFMATSREMMRKLYDQMFKYEAEHGSKTEYRKGYIRHVFEDQDGVQKWLDETYIPSLGANGFQKARAFDTIDAAVKAGFKLKYDNPIDLLTSRWKMGVNSSLVTATLRRLEKDGLAFPVGGTAPKYTRDWQKYQNNIEGKQWVIHPDAQPLWDNAMVAKGLAEQDNVIGTVYNGWMQVKRVWAPVQLMLGAFHATHIAVGNVVQNLSTAIGTAMKTGQWGKELGKAGKLSMDQTLFSLPLDKINIGGIGAKLDAMAGGKFSGNVGRNVMDYWHLPDSQLTPDQRMTIGLLREMGVVPENSKQEVIGAKRALETALAKSQYVKVGFAGIRRGIEKIQAPLFNYMIPSMKVQAALNAAGAAIQRDPELLTNHVKRQQVMREVGQNIHDRYGEMFYDAMFWNKAVKDIGIGSMLSLSWNVGQLRQVAGGVRDLYMGARGVAGLPTNSGGRMAQFRRGASDKATFVATYAALTMGIGGLMSWAMSGELPSGLDYIFPRNGLKNPDGTPARMTTPFNTREPTMLMAHSEEHGNLIGGTMAFLWNKMMLSPLTEAFQNRDFFGRELFDPDAPWYKRAVQLVDSTLGNHLSPILLSGVDRVKAQGGGAGREALAWAGFGPAPKYVSNDEWQNRINELYFSNFGSRAYEYGKTGLGRGLIQTPLREMMGDQLRSEGMQEGREKMNQGYATGNDALRREGLREMVTKGGISPRYGAHFLPGQEFQWKFSKLPPDTQRALYRIMSPQARQTYVMQNPKISTNAKVKITRP